MDYFRNYFVQAPEQEPVLANAEMAADSAAEDNASPQVLRYRQLLQGCVGRRLNLTNEIVQQRVKIEQLTAQLRLVENQYAALAQNQAATASGKSNCDNEVRKLNQALQETRKMLSFRETEIEKLRTNLNQSEYQAHDVIEENAKLRQAIQEEELRQQIQVVNLNRACEKESKELREALQSCGSKREELQKLLLEKISALTKCNQTAAEQHGKLISQLESVESKLSSCQASFQDCHKNRQIHVDQLPILRQNFNDIKNELKDCHNETERFRRESEELKQSIRNLSGDQNSFQEKLQAVQRQVIQSKQNAAMREEEYKLQLQNMHERLVQAQEKSREMTAMFARLKEREEGRGVINGDQQLIQTLKEKVDECTKSSLELFHDAIISMELEFKLPSKKVDEFVFEYGGKTQSLAQVHQTLDRYRAAHFSQ